MKNVRNVYKKVVNKLVMNYEQQQRLDWEKRISDKTQQVVSDYNEQSNGEIPLEDAIVGVLAECEVKEAIPRIIVRTSERSAEGSLSGVFDRLLEMMKTPTFHTANYTHPDAVKLAKSLCHKNHIASGIIDREASYVLHQLFPERVIVYFDEGRDLSQYAGKIFEKLNLQFGKVDVAIAFHAHEGLTRMIGLSLEIASNWERHTHVRDGTTGMAIMDQIDLGFDTLADYIPDEVKEGVDPMIVAIDAFVASANRARIPYRNSQYELRGIPVTLG
jgi:hypothetical protein